jgi:serine/threonine-protein kinase RsbT
MPDDGLPLELKLLSSEDVVPVRRLAVELGFSLVDQTKLVTAASELARNTVIHGGGGSALIETAQRDMRRGVRVTFHDDGPGIPDVVAAMKDGFTTGSGLGLGLGGAKRLTDEFEIQSRPGEGTRVQFTRWR